MLFPPFFFFPFIFLISFPSFFFLSFILSFPTHSPPAPPEPPVATKPTDPSNEESYKEYMRIRYEHEGWENQVLLLARRLRAQAQQQGQ